MLKEISLTSLGLFKMMGKILEATLSDCTDSSHPVSSELIFGRKLTKESYGAVSCVSKRNSFLLSPVL